jgi:uncharacterized protein YbaR (Trm112 family)
MSCPKCGAPLEYYDAEGGYCEECDQWFPEDQIQEWLEENE